MIGNKELAELLIKNGAEVNALDENHQTPVMLALKNGKLISLLSLNIFHIRDRNLSPVSINSSCRLSHDTTMVRIAKLKEL